MANTDSVTNTIMSISNMEDFLELLQNDESVRNRLAECVESITWDVQSQKVVLKMNDLLKTESDLVEKKVFDRTKPVDLLTQLSEKYKLKSKELHEHLEKWKSARNELIDILRRSAYSIDRNSIVVSTIRIVSSATDIWGTLMRTGGASRGSWANFAMQHASLFGIISHLLEKNDSRLKFRNVKKAIKKDKKLFEEMTNLLKETEDVDGAIKRLFPYGIDENLTKEIAKFKTDWNDCEKIFMSVIGSNVRQRIELSKDKKFLDNAKRFSTSYAGKQWFQKIILENDPTFIYEQNVNIANDIQDILKSSAEETPELYAEGCSILPGLVKLKITINIMTIFSAGHRLVTGYNPEESDTLRELLETTEKGLKRMNEAICDFQPS